MKYVKTFEEFVNESYNIEGYINEGKNLTSIEDENSYIAFKESSGPYFAGFGIYSNNGNAEQTKLFPHLGDRGLKLLVDGLAFRRDVCQELGITETTYGNGIVLDIPRGEFISMMKKKGFKKKGDDYEIQIREPKQGVKVIVDALKSLPIL